MLLCMSLAGCFALRKLYISGDGLLANMRENAQRGLCKASMLSKHVRFSVRIYGEVHVQAADGKQGAGSA